MPTHPSGTTSFIWQSFGTMLAILPWGVHLFRLFMVICLDILVFSATDACQVQELAEWLEQRDLMMQLVRRHLLRTQ